MRIRIMFPDGHEEEFEVEVEEGMTVDEIAYEIAEEMCEKWARAMVFGRRRKKGEIDAMKERCINGQLKWLVPHLVEALALELERMRKRGML